MSERILIAVDDSRASAEAVRYVGRLFEGSTQPTFVLFNVVAPPSSMKTFQGTGIEGTVGPIESGTSRAQIVAQAEKEARPVIEGTAAVLTSFGIAEERIENVWAVPGPSEDLEHEILNEADKLGCGTIVVGRRALPWYREPFHVHVADKLVKHARGHTLWIVENGD